MKKYNQRNVTDFSTTYYIPYEGCMPRGNYFDSNPSEKTAILLSFDCQRKGEELG